MPCYVFHPGLYLFTYFSLVYISFFLEHLSGMRRILLSLFLISHNCIRVIDHMNKEYRQYFETLVRAVYTYYMVERKWQN